MKYIRQKFEQIHDPRHGSYVEYNLVDILVMVMGAVLCGVTELADMMVYFEKRLGFFSKKFGITKYPSKPTMSRILNMVDGDTVGTLIAEIMRENTKDLGDLIAVDGKAIRSTGEKGKPHSFLQILSAYATESGVTLAQSAISHRDKTNEIPVFQAMLDHLDVKGKIITADAMHCQKDTCAKITEKGGHYIFGLKGNQGELYENVELYFKPPMNHPEIVSSETLEQNGGRIEKRVIRATDQIEWLPNLPLWCGIRTIFAITRTTTVGDKTTEETGYYISSLPCDPAKLLAATRAHWKIEAMHWLLDVVWGEDESGILSENGHKTLNAFRKLAVLAHKRHISGLSKKPSVKGNVLAALLDDEVLWKVMECL